jgi:uncharacterized protein YprB with RNaseH-like and TPR domain
LSALADRIRGIVAPHAPRPTGSETPLSAPVPPPADLPDVAAALGGQWRDGCFIVDRRWERSALYGRESIGALAERLEGAAGEASLFTTGSPARPPFVFFDLETTGLNGGAGTLAFLVGCGWFDTDGTFATRQFLLAPRVDERVLLGAVAGELARAGALVSFNGKSFDAPLLEGRYLFHRIAWRGREMPHIDVLHPARRFWKHSAEQAPPARSRADNRLAGAVTTEATTRRFAGAQLAPPESACSLQALERHILGARRRGDVPGFEIPARYFQFVRSGDARPLAAVLEHNRLDLLTLAALTTRLLHIARSGPDAIADAREALALGHLYARAHRHAQGDWCRSKGGGLDDRAYASFRRALERCRSPRAAFDPIRIEALRALALACRRARRHDEAAGLWRELLEIRGCPPPIVREAAEALAIHHEHRVCDLPTARRFALGSLEALTGAPRPSLVQAVRHRLARIERKMSEFENGQLLD